MLSDLRLNRDIVRAKYIDLGKEIGMSNEQVFDLVQSLRRRRIDPYAPLVLGEGAEKYLQDDSSDKYQKACKDTVECMKDGIDRGEIMAYMDATLIMKRLVKETVAAKRGSRQVLPIIYNFYRNKVFVYKFSRQIQGNPDNSSPIEG